MKNNFCNLAALALFAVALTGAALAQDLVRANTPIDFYAGGKLLPAGEYTISVNVLAHEIAIEQIASRSYVLGSPDDGSHDNRTMLTFKLVAGHGYALRELQAPNFGLSFKATSPQASMRAKNREASP